ncbi:transcription elongation factor, mitochondrial [Epargyreus clarus]|uniref:transcription elongation factor, mitochondrial n=1 Tax=Epargyreus clarus TaxID=520877 RepID=UPI003C2EA22C
MIIVSTKQVLSSSCWRCRILSTTSRYFSQELEKNYTSSQKEKILQIINETNAQDLSRYNITKVKLKKITEWITKKGQIKTISDIGAVDGFTERYAKKLCDSILEGPQVKEPNINKKIKGQVLHPPLPEDVRKNCKTVLAVYVTVNSVCWTLIDRSKYEVLEWQYKPIEYPEGKSMKITDILDLAWHITSCLPAADIYVMKAEATSLRAGGSDPNNPKVLGVNLQKAQMISMIVAFINSKFNDLNQTIRPSGEVSEADMKFQHKVYFLRPTLPFRLYGTLVGNERVSTDQTVEELFQQGPTGDGTRVLVPERWRDNYRARRELQRDMLGHGLLLALTFMDVCVYRNQESIEKLIRRAE